MGLPTYRATSEEMRALKSSSVITEKTTRAVLMDRDNVSVFVKQMLQDEGMSLPAGDVVQIEDDDDDEHLDEQPTPKSKGGRRKTMNPELLPQAIHDEMERFHRSLTITLTRREAIAAETWRKTEVNTLSK